MQIILRKRVLRDLKENLFRYLALGILILVSMYLIVSMLGAAETIIQGGEYFEKQQNVEAGQFTVFVPLNKTQIGELKRKGVQLENTFYMDFSVKDDSTLRIFKDRTSIDKVYVEKVLQDKMEYNLESIIKFSVFGDLTTMFRTVFAVLGKDYK